jgi:hypothetical protein
MKIVATTFVYGLAVHASIRPKFGSAPARLDRSTYGLLPPDLQWPDGRRMAAGANRRPHDESIFNPNQVSASGAALVPHASRERPGDVKKR